MFSKELIVFVDEMLEYFFELFFEVEVVAVPLEILLGGVFELVEEVVPV